MNYQAKVIRLFITLYHFTIKKSNTGLSQFSSPISHNKKCAVCKTAHGASRVLLFDGVKCEIAVLEAAYDLFAGLYAAVKQFFGEGVLNL